MFEAVITIVFTLWSSMVPLGGVEGPYVLPGYTSHKACMDSVDSSLERWSQREASEHNIAVEGVVVLAVCRSARDEGA